MLRKMFPCVDRLYVVCPRVCWLRAPITIECDYSGVRTEALFVGVVREAWMANTRLL